MTQGLLNVKFDKRFEMQNPLHIFATNQWVESPAGGTMVSLRACAKSGTNFRALLSPIGPGFGRPLKAERRYTIWRDRLTWPLKE